MQKFKTTNITTLACHCFAYKMCLIFSVVKQTGASNRDSVQSTSSNQLHPAQIHKPPPRINQQHNQPTQYNNQGQQRVDQPFGNQGRPKSGGTYQNKHNVSRYGPL